MTTLAILNKLVDEVELSKIINEYKMDLEYTEKIKDTQRKLWDDMCELFSKVDILVGYLAPEYSTYEEVVTVWDNHFANLALYSLAKRD